MPVPAWRCRRAGHPHSRIAAALQWLYEAVAPIAAGADVRIAPEKPHDVIRHAPAMLHLLGFGPAEALRAVTSAAAGVCGLGHRIGRIAPGFDADILAIDGDPIADRDALHCIRAVYPCAPPCRGRGHDTGPGLGNALTPSLTLGCGSYGRTSTTDNVTYTNLVNIKRVAHPLAGVGVLPASNPES